MEFKDHKLIHFVPTCIFVFPYGYPDQIDKPAQCTKILGKSFFLSRPQLENSKILIQLCSKFGAGGQIFFSHFLPILVKSAVNFKEIDLKWTKKSKNFFEGVKKSGGEGMSNYDIFFGLKK